VATIDLLASGSDAAISEPRGLGSSTRPRAPAGHSSDEGRCIRPCSQDLLVWFVGSRFVSSARGEAWAADRRQHPGYILAQLLGAVRACLSLWALFGDVAMLGATEPGPGVTGLQAAAVEMLLTLGLVSTILGTASSAQNVGTMSAIGVGAYIVLAGLWSALPGCCAAA
jgi:Major intrinsic protein